MTMTLTTRWVDVCATEALRPGRGAAALVGGEQVALFLLPCGAIHAIDNYDPISGAQVMSRGIVGSLGDSVVVASPMYKHHIDLTTGVCLERPEVTVRTWPVQVVDDRVLVGAPSS
ncbi:MAG: nitrite reductase small subunit NirD [Acidimicrobiales bacterium]